MREYKLNMTRPEFMRRIITQCDDSHYITEDDLRRYLDMSDHLQYCCYSALMEADINPDDVKYVNIDDESVVVKLSSKSLAKEVKEKSNKEIIRFGMIFYKIKIKVDGPYIIVTATPDHTLADVSDNY
jgi:hypothetical protein